MKNRFLLYAIVSLFLIGCIKKEAEVVLFESNTIPPAATAQTDSLPVEIPEEKPLINILPSDIVQIVVRQDGAPGMYLGEDGEVHGFYVDLEKLVMEEMGQSYQFVPYSDVGPIIQKVKSGVYQLALAVPDLPDYRTFLNLSIPYEILHYVTFVQKGNTRISGATREEIIKSLYGKKVGVQTQGHIYQALRDRKEIELIEYPTTTKALEDLNRGLLDAVPDVGRIGLFYTAQNNWDIEPVGEPIISHFITTGISRMIDMSFVERYNIALGVILADGRLEALYASYFGPMDDIYRP